MDCSPVGFSVHGILQARILEWVAISSPEDIPHPGIKPVSPTLAGEFFTAEPPCLGSNPGSVLTGCVTLGELLIYLV